MITPNSLLLIAVGIALLGGGVSVFAEDDVAVISTPTKTTAKSEKTVDSDGTPVIHKSAHKKKQTAVATAPATNTAPSSTAPASSTSPAVAETKLVKKPTPETVTAVHPQPPVQSSAPIQSPVVVVNRPPPPPIPVQPLVIMKSASQPVPPPTVPAFPKPVASVTPVATAPSPVIVVGGKSIPPAKPDPERIVELTSGHDVAGPTVETGLPVARYPGMGAPIRGVSTYSPISPPVKSVAGASTHLPYFATALPASVLPMTSTAAGSYSLPDRTTDPAADFTFKDLSRKVKNTYPWKTRIVTTMFWIGEGATPISSTTNVSSSWDEDWRDNNHGTDSPTNRNGYASGGHASTLNPFYVALPFNDLAFPDKAHRWLPAGWYQRPKDGRQVSACKDHWVEIKNAKGDVCYAQWEDVGPLRYDHAEYVFGDERPIGMGDNHAGLDVSPAVAEYLGIDHKDRPTTSWRFVDAEDVRPGAWLKLDEQAVLYTALHQLKSAKGSALPIQKASEPIDDPSKADQNKKKVGASKG